jgi:ligand-binding sensor domain-containing protein
MKYVLIYTLFLMFVFCSSCRGQNQPYLPPDIIRSETKDSVSFYGPNHMVRNVKQARNGDILIASFTGVWRYDGKLFTNITSAISSPSFWDVLEDRKGNLWFGTRDSGVYCYNGKSFLHYTTRQGLASNMALHIYEDRAGNIWFGASRYDGKSFQNFTTKDGLPHNGGTAIMEDKTGKLWIATGDGPCFYDGKKFTFLKNKDGKLFKNVWSIIEDKKGSIWFGDVDGLWRYDGSTFTKVSRRVAFAIIEDKKGNIWTTGEVKPNGYWGLSRYDQKFLYSKPAVTEIMTRKGPGMLCGILEANDGSIWFGALGAIISGVFRYDGKTITDFRRKGDQK